MPAMFSRCLAALARHQPQLVAHPQAEVVGQQPADHGVAGTDTEAARRRCRRRSE